MKLTSVAHAFIVTIILSITSAAIAQTEPIVGTWKKSNNTQLEIREDGSIHIDGQPIGTWMRKTSAGKVLERQYYLRWNGDVRLYSARLEAHDRKLTASTATGATGFIERVYNGPTANPDVADEQTARLMQAADERANMQMEAARLQADIERLTAERESLLRGADAARQAHTLARLTGKISAHMAVASKREMDAVAISNRIAPAKARLTYVQSMLASRP